MGVPSLAELCRKTAKANINEVCYMPDLPYEVIRDILLEIRYATQLLHIEEESPQIVDHDGEVWEALVLKDFRVQHRKSKAAIEANCGEWRVEDHGGNWRQVYHNYCEAEAQREAESIAMLANNMAAHNKAKEKARASLIDPRGLRLNTRGSRSSGVSYSTSAGTGAAWGWGWGAISRSKNLVQRARQEAAEAGKMKRLTMTQLSEHSKAKARGARSPGRSTITAAPRGLLAERRIRRQPKFLPPTQAKSHNTVAEEKRARREARLLAFKNGEITKPSFSAAKSTEHRPSNKPDENLKPSTPKKPTSSKGKGLPGSGLLNSSRDTQKQQQTVVYRTTTIKKPSSGVKSKPASSVISPLALPRRDAKYTDRPPAQEVTPAKRHGSPQGPETSGGGGTGQPPLKKKRADNVFMPKKRTR